MPDFTKDITKSDVERSREIVVRNAEELTDAQRIRTVLSREELFSQQLLESYILEALINRPEYAATEEELIEEVRALEQHVLDEARDPDALRYADGQAVEILRAVLEVALEDDRVSSEELTLIRRLRQKLDVHEKTKRVGGAAEVGEQGGAAGADPAGRPGAGRVPGLADSRRPLRGALGAARSQGEREQGGAAPVTCLSRRWAWS